MRNPPRTRMESYGRWLILGAILLCLGQLETAGATEPTPDPDAAAEPEPAPLSPVAAAAPANPDAENSAFGTIEEQVHQRMLKARTHFNAGQYDDAIRELQAAYALKPNANYLFSIAQSHRRAGRNREALTFYERFLKSDPNTPLKVEATNYIAELTVLIRQHEAIELEKKRPLWKKPWVWGVVGSFTLAAGLGLGLGLGLRDSTPTIGFNFGTHPSALTSR